MATSRRSSRSKSRRPAPRAAPLLQLALVLTAGALLITPPPAAWVERWYAAAFYPALQAALTTLSNLVPIAVFDVVLVLLVAGLLFVWVRAVRAARRDRSAWPVAGALTTTVVLAATVYLWFLLAWGLNYARPPLEVRLDLRDVEVTTEEVRALAMQAVTMANETHQAAHRAGFPGVIDRPASLAEALAAVEQEQGRPRATVPAHPKRTLLGWFFQAAGVDGMLAPFALETLVHTGVTGPERPFLIAHEWAHLSGYADEADANLIAWLVTTRADVASLYSAWLYVAMAAAAQLPAADRAEVLAAVGPGPQADLDAITARLSERIDVVQRASLDVYDQYLRTQGVQDGVRSYSRGISLIVRYGAR
ncbi:MAG: DUF3810 family protein [Vicinamibacterales bacterium]|nr:DUF3810 family protein [Vicinamibacterales bacterium]